VVLIAALLALWIFGERGHLMLPSTRRAMRGGGKRSGSKPSSAAPRKKPNLLDTLHSYIYGRWTNQYVYVLLHWIVPRLDARGRAHQADTYHGKVLTPELAAEIVTLDHDVNARNLEQIIPYPIARDVILKTPLAITLYECACRHARANPCQPTNVCMNIGDATGFMVEHNPHSARRITQQEALEILRAEHERGHLHSAWFKDVLGDRFYAICNCCKCCCGGIEGMVKYGVPSMVSSGFVAAIDAANCTACGVCAKACPFSALSLHDGAAVVNRDKCMGCGVCQGQCAFEAIALLRDEARPPPLDVRVL
jgi:ferredoxin